MTISLPEGHRAWLEEVAARNECSVDDVIVSLIDGAQEVESAVSKALHGPPAEPLTDENLEIVRRRFTDRGRQQP
jgi:hypothetical protein